MPLPRHAPKLDEATRAWQTGDPAAAERLCRAHLLLHKGDVRGLHLLAVILADSERQPEAATLLAQCVAIAPSRSDLRADLARMLVLLGQHAEAANHLKQHLRTNPGDRRAATDLADVLERMGRRDDAWAALSAVCPPGTQPPDDDAALVALRLLHHARRDEDAIEMATRALAGPITEPGIRRLLLQQVGRIRDRTGDLDGAFAAFAEAKRMEALPFDAAEWVRMVDEVIRAFPGGDSLRTDGPSTAWDAPVFIACMPRSGSTLAEQVLHAHPAATGTGELPALGAAVEALVAARSGAPYPACVRTATPAQFEGAARSVRGMLERAAPGATRIMNKHLQNYLQLGLVAALFPKARVVHIRRERVDNAFACFMASLPPGVAPWSSRFADLAVAWRQYERIMDHWARTLPIPILEVRYEDLVGDTEAQVRRLVDFTGLPWDDRCLRWWECDRVALTPSYDQVRRPIDRGALDRAERYGRLVDPLRVAMAR
jgi:tetratricopeptide (TPR) repeat protein